MQKKVEVICVKQNFKEAYSGALKQGCHKSEAAIIPKQTGRKVCQHDKPGKQ